MIQEIQISKFHSSFVPILLNYVSQIVSANFDQSTILVACLKPPSCVYMMIQITYQQSSVIERQVLNVIIVQYI